MSLHNTVHRGLELIQQLQDLHSRQGLIAGGQVPLQMPSNQPVFFFDGEFRTWPEVEHRAQLNAAISVYLAKKGPASVRL